MGITIPFERAGGGWYTNLPAAAGIFKIQKTARNFYAKENSGIVSSLLDI